MGPLSNTILVAGIDPGLSGAVSKIWIDALTKAIVKYEVFDIPVIQIAGTSKHEYNIVLLAALISGIKEDPSTLKFIYLEKVHAMPGQGVTSMFNMGFGFGLIRMALVANLLSTKLVTPQAWKKAIMSGMGKEKSQSVVRAQELFPEAVLTTPRGKALDGRGDALLIAYYGYQEFHL